MLCGLYDLPVPADLANLVDGSSGHQIGDAVPNTELADYDEEEPDDDEEDDEEPENLEDSDEFDEENLLEGSLNGETDTATVRHIYFHCRKF